MDFSVNEDIPGLLSFIDFEKAFESVEWNFLHESLKMFRCRFSSLGEKLTFYNNIQSCIMNNGTLFFYKNTYNLAEPEDVLILSHTFS